MHTVQPIDTCAADDEGRPCARQVVASRPVPLCHAHRVEIAMTVVPELLRNGLETALAGGSATLAAREDLTATAVSTPVEALLHGVHDSVVYFIANGGRVKIGYTTNLKSRLGALALRSDSVLLALHGGPELERALHARFAEYRNGNTEWFELSPEVFRYASGRASAPLSGQSGLPFHPCPSGEAEEQITELARRLHRGEQITKTGAADILGVSLSTAYRRLKEARDRLNEGTGLYL